MFRNLNVVVTAFVALVFIFGCKKDEWAGRPDRGLVYLRLINAAPLSPAVDVEVEYYNARNRWARQFGSPATYPNYGYLALEGIDAPNEFQYNIDTLQALFRVDSTNVDTTTTKLLVSKNKRYSVFLTDSLDLRKAPFFTYPDRAWVILEDNFKYTSEDSTTGTLRFVNLAHRKSLFMTIPALNQTTAPVEFMKATDFLELKNNAYELRFYTADGEEIGSLPAFTIEKMKSYTIYFDGQALHSYRHD